MFRTHKKEILLSLASFFVFSLSSFFITFPLVFHMGDMATGVGDEFVISWIVNYVIHAFSTNPHSLFDANVYFPYHNTLAYSDLHLVSAILAIIPLAVVGQPIAAFNFTVISSLILLGFSIYLLSFYLTKNFCASLLSGLLVIFSPAVLDKTIHIQILAIQWVPLAILFFLMFLEKKKTVYLAISLLFFLLQTYNSFMPGYFILFSYFIIFILKWINKRKQMKEVVTKKNIFLFLSSFILLIPIVLPYYGVSKEFNYKRDIRDAVHFALQPEDLFYTSPLSRSYSVLNSLPFNQQSQNNEFKPGYLGFIFSILVVIVLWRFIRNFRKNGYILNGFISIGLVGLVLSLGPVLHLGRQTVHVPFLIPLPYMLFYYLLPGFQGFRNSARWEMLFILAMAVAIALVLGELLEKVKRKKKIIIYSVLILGCIAEFSFPMQLQTVPQVKDFPKVYSWIATTAPDAKIIELPIYNWNMDPFTSREIYREYYGTVHFRKTVNGYTGFSPPPWQILVTDITAHFPNESTINKLRQLGIDYVIIHTDEYDACSKTNICGHQKTKNGNEIIGAVKQNQLFTLVTTFDNTYVFALKNN